jgi:hypothetical protein
MEYAVPELRYSVLPVHVVGAPPTELVKVPPTSREVPDERVKFVAAVSVKFPVVVAWFVMVHPPPAAFMVRLKNGEDPGFTVSPVSVEFKRTVPLLWVNVPRFWKEPAI